MLTVRLQIKLTFTTWTGSFGHCSVAWHHQPVHSRFLFHTKESFREEELHFQLMVEKGELETFYFRKQGWCMTVAKSSLIVLVADWEKHPLSRSRAKSQFSRISCYCWENCLQEVPKKKGGIFFFFFRPDLIVKLYKNSQQDWENGREAYWRYSSLNEWIPVWTCH